VAVLSLAGCLDPHLRMQSADDAEKVKDLDVRTIGDVTSVSNGGALAISGVGLVTGLEATGGSPAGTFRKMLEEQLLKQKVEHVKKLLDSPDNALVLVSALIPPGARRGDPIDISVTLPPGSKATSLRGGYLELCTLRNYESKQNIYPDYKGPNSLLPGHILAHAQGPLLVGFGAKDEGQLRCGTIWGGGVTHTDRPFYLILNKDQKFARVANAVAERINFMFQDDPKKQLQVQANRRLYVLDEVTQQINQKFTPATLGRGTTAKAVNKEVVHLNVPFAYRFNPERYLRVARLIPLQESADKKGRYRVRLEKMLADPAETIRTALRLEALGKDSVPILKRGLEADHPLVRFSAAEALAYLGSTAGCEELARLAEAHAELRSYCLMALASLEEGICRGKLEDMMACPDAELRCGAFQALRLIDETDKRLHAERPNNAFWLHQVASQSRPMAYFAVRERPEIVLFGSDIRLVPTPPDGVKILVGDFTITADCGDDRCTVSRILVNETNVLRQQCSLRLIEVLRTLAELGGQYTDAVDLLKKAHDRRCLSCPVRSRTLPEQVPVETLAAGGRNPDFLK
jgi:hypothetical protein